MGVAKVVWFMFEPFSKWQWYPRFLFAPPPPSNCVVNATLFFFLADKQTLVLCSSRILLNLWCKCQCSTSHETKKVIQFKMLSVIQTTVMLWFFFPPNANLFSLPTLWYCHCLYLFAFKNWRKMKDWKSQAVMKFYSEIKFCEYRMWDFYQVLLLALQRNWCSL